MCGSSRVSQSGPADQPLQALRCDDCGTSWSVPPSRATGGPNAKHPDAVPSTQPRILVVDDDTAIIDLVSAWLSNVGVIYTATTAAQALALAKVVRPDVAVVDVVLPRMDGFDLVDALRHEPATRQTQVVFITGFERGDIGFRSLDVAAAAVLFKPLDEDLLRETVVTLLRRIDSRSEA